MASGYSEARRIGGGMQYDHPHVGFYAEMADEVQAPSHHQTKNPVLYDWPEVTIERPVLRAGSHWAQFGKDLALRSRAIGEAVDVNDMAIVYVEPDAISSMLTRQYPKIASKPNDTAREQVANNFVQQFNQAIGRQRRVHVATELGYLMGETFDLPERARQARESDFVDYEIDEDPTSNPAIWSAAQFQVGRVDNRGNYEMVLALEDPTGIIETERNMLSDIFREDMKFKQRPNIAEDEPAVTILHTRRQIHTIKHSIVPPLPYELPLGPPQATLG